ncbi:hypothetical protein GpartN1_g4903.t1 [Galdieria partita]|uniref:Uncharacterized protein n=1 Tax=Galdieria partita TaxID=83374 RepID=A0A9C7Q082_9RHOD|nr:hypothetical protein GpartN1_g4903.t1 [Galdieria partita]
MSSFFNYLLRLDTHFKPFKLWPLIFIGLLLFISRDSGEQQLIPLLYQQQSLYKDIPLPAVQVAGTHNSYCSTSYGYNLCNNGEIPRHFLSLTEQLDRGFRLLELDVHYIPQLSEANSTSKTDAIDSSAFRLCHPCGDGCFWLSLICLKSIPDYGKGHRGCSKHALTLEKAFCEIIEWLRRHPDEFVFLYLDSFIDDVAAGIALNECTENWSQSLAFSQQDLAIWRTNNGISSDTYDSWPSIRQLLEMGKQLIIDSRIDNTVVNENSFIFPDLSNIRWPYSQLQYLKPLHEQMTKNLSLNEGAFQRSLQSEDSRVGCGIRTLSESEQTIGVYSPYFSRMVWEGHLTGRAWKWLKDAVHCGYSFRVDVPNFSTWNRILRIFEWSFSTVGSSQWVKGHSCTKLTTERWKTVSNDENDWASVACVCEEWYSKNYLSARGYRQSWWCTSSSYPCLSKMQGNQLCNQSKPSSCASASFSSPVTALENEILKYTMKDYGVDSVWIASNDH